MYEVVRLFRKSGFGNDGLLLGAFFKFKLVQEAFKRNFGQMTKFGYVEEKTGKMLQ